MDKYCRIILPIIIASFSYSLIFAEELQFKDGAYEGQYSFVKVAVTIKEDKIANIEILEHAGGGQKYTLMVEPLLEEIIKRQTTEVDAVSGATVSSENLRKAVADALQKASTTRGCLEVVE